MEGGKKLTDEEKQAVINGTYKPSSATEEKVEEKTEKIEEKVEDKVEEKIEEKPLDFSVFKKFGKEIETEDDLKALFEKADKYEVTSKSYSEATEKLEEYKGLAEKLDPLSNFLNEDEYKRQQLLIKMGKELGEDAIKALSVLNPSKMKQMSDKDIIKTKLLIEEGLTGEEADAFLSRKYGVEDFGDEDIDVGVRAEIKVDAKNARKSMLGLYDGIDVPTRVDYETARTQLKESWSGVVPELVKGIDKIQISEGIDFVVTDAMKEGLIDSTMSVLMSKQIKPSEEAAAKIIGDLKDRILLKNIGNVAKSIEADLREKIKAETRAELHNDKPLNEGNRTTTDTVDNDAKMSKILK